MKHDFSLNSGERQTAVNYEAIRADHRFRYEWAAERIPSHSFGLDVFCGNGYGTWLLGDTRFVIGIDGSQEAINLANKCYRRTTTLFSSAIYPFELPENSFDFIVALESIEHVARGAEFFDCICRALKPGGNLIFSTPCEDFLPHSATGNHFHYKHYSLKETLVLANSNGLSLISYSGQNTYELDDNGMQGNLLPMDQMHLKSGEAGQFIIVHSRMKRDCDLNKSSRLGWSRLSKFFFNR